MVCWQELRVVRSGRAAADLEARLAGWGLTRAKCGQGPRGRPSVGVGVCVKRHMCSGASVDPAVHNVLVVPVRAAATLVRARGLTPPVLVINVYMTPGVGMIGAFAHALGQIMTFAEAWVLATWWRATSTPLPCR